MINAQASGDGGQVGTLARLIGFGGRALEYPNKGVMGQVRRVPAIAQAPAQQPQQPGMVIAVKVAERGGRVKETDRLSAMATELRKVGAEVEEGQDYIRVVPPAQLIAAEIETYNDHRMAMCFSLVALSDTPVTILDPKCTAKTFPDYFEQLARLSRMA